MKNTCYIVDEYLQAMIKLQITFHQHTFRLPSALQNIFLFFGTLQSTQHLSYQLTRKITRYHIFANVSIQARFHNNRYIDFRKITILLLIPINTSYFYGINSFINTGCNISIQTKYILVTHSIIKSSNDHELGMFITSILTLVLIFIVDNFKEIICKASYNNKIEGFEVVENQNLDLIVQLLKLLQIAVYLFTTSQAVPTIIQGTLTISINIIKIYQTVITINYIKYEFILIQIITQSISLTYVLCSIFNYQDLVLIISILLMTLLNHQVTSTINNLLLCFENIKKSKDIKTFVALYLNSFTQYGTPFFQLQQRILINNHRVKCWKINCFCKEDIQCFPLSKFQKLILKKLDYNNIQVQTRFKQVKLSDILFYVASLHQLGFVIRAFQQTINLINRDKFDQKNQYQINNTAQSVSLSSSQTLRSHLKAFKKLVGYQEHNISKRFISQKIIHKTPLEEARLALLQSDIFIQLKENFTKDSDGSQLHISEAINLFIQSELGQTRIKQQIISLIQQKIQLFELLLVDYTSTMLYNRAKDISQKFVKVEDDLIMQYEKFPSQKLQAVLCFLQGEIFNDYLKAFKYGNFTTISDEKLINMRKNIKLNLFSNKITYINVKLSDNLQTLLIQSVSNNAHIFFGYNNAEEFNQYESLDFLIPDAIINQHRLLITQYIQNGSSKFFRYQNQNFFKLQNQFIQQFSMLFDINNYASNGIQFAVFCEQIDQAAAHILLDTNLLIAGISMNLFEKIGYNHEQIKDNSHKIQEYYKVSIYELIPNFDDLNKSGQKQYNLAINLFDVLQQAIQQSQYFSFKHLPVKKNIIEYKVTLSINQRQIHSLCYYIIEIDDLKQNKKQVKYESITKNTNFVQMPKIMKISDLVNNPPSINDSMEEGSVRLPQDIQKKHFIEFHDLKQNVLEQEQKQYNLNDIILSPVLSPNIYPDQLVQQRLVVEQQQFFNLQIQRDDKKSRTTSQNVRQEIDERVNDVDRNMQQLIKKQFNQEQENKFIDDQGSQVSSLAGIRKSPYFKKYDVIQATILRSKMPISFKYCISQFVTFILITSTYNILILEQNSIDLNRFIQYVDMHIFNQQFMAPFGMFTSTRIMWAQLPTDYSFGSIDPSVYNVIYPWMFTTFGQQFAVMRTNFQLQFQNAYLQEFFNDDYLRVYYQQTQPNNLTLVNITFKETLFQFLNYQYMYKIGYEQGKSLRNLPMQTYSWVNYFILTSHFESLTENILLYTQDAKDIIAKKWWIQSSIFISLTGIIMIIGYLLYRAFITNYDSYLQIFSFTDQSEILKDIERYKIFLNLLSKDSDVMFKYVFKLDVKEQFALNQQPEQKEAFLNYKVSKKKSSEQKFTLPYLNSLIGFTLIYALYFAFTLIITFETQTYLKKYSQTIVFYKQLADLDTRLCGIYGEKLFANIIINFPFFTKSNFTDTQKRILQSTQIMSNFSAIAYSIESTQYLFSSNFSDTFNAAKTGSICALLSPTDLAYAGQYCGKAFDGSLLLGLNPSLNFIINEIITEYTVNQFQQRIYGTNIYSVQGAYILSRVIELLIQELKNSILVSTYSQQKTVQTSNIIYLAYAFVFMLLLLSFIIKYYTDDYYFTKRFVLLIPSQTLLLNDNLERQLRIYVARHAQ